MRDRAWDLIYVPPVRWLHALARRAARLQTGRIRTYLVHSFLTLLLWVVT